MGVVETFQEEHFAAGLIAKSQYANLPFVVLVYYPCVRKCEKVVERLKPKVGKKGLPGISKYYSFHQKRSAFKSSFTRNIQSLP